VTVILLTNDDGIDAEGLKTLEKALKDLAHLVVVAPDQERSAASHALTLRTKLQLKEVGADHYVINGTPADCVIFALRHLFVQPPDLVISGINHGANLGDDIMYSGTVAAAREAAHHGVPSMAISQAYYNGEAIRFKRGAGFVREMVAAVLRTGLSGDICLNVNIPVRKIKGAKVTRQGCAEYIPHFNALDRAEEYEPVPPSPVAGPKTELMSDHDAIMQDYVSITPLQRDQTDYAAAQSLLREAATLFPSK
jgi:5'-nucleotidase